MAYTPGIEPLPATVRIHISSLLPFNAAMTTLSQLHGLTLPACLVAGFCAISGASSNSAHAPTATYAAEKVICITHPDFPRVQFSKGKVDFRQSQLIETTNALYFSHGDTIYTGIDGFISLLISPDKRVNVSPQSQVRIERSSDCLPLPRPVKKVELTRVTPKSWQLTPYS